VRDVAMHAGTKGVSVIQNLARRARVELLKKSDNGNYRFWQNKRTCELLGFVKPAPFHDVNW